MSSLNLYRTNTRTAKPKENEGDGKDNIIELVALIIHDLKTKFGEKKITVSTVHLILKESMELVDDLKCDGNDKKKHVIFITKALIMDLVEDENERIVLIMIIDRELVENMVDLIIAASKGRLNINKKKDKKKIIGCVSGSVEVLCHIVILGFNKFKLKSKRG